MNATPRPMTTATELQQARECVAATINQDETLTIKEAREHASQALDHIEQAEEAFDAMRELINQNDDLLAELSQYVSNEHIRLIAEQRKRNNDTLDRIQEDAEA